jgi:hypothetical protein
MKRIAFSFLLAALLSSCGPSHPLNAVRLKMQDNVWHDYMLLDTHDTAIVVFAAEQSKDHLEVIPLHDMRRIAFQGRTTIAEVLGGVGFFVIFISALPVTPWAEIITLASIPLGTYLGHILTDRWIDLDPYSLEAREFLLDRSNHSSK